MQMSKKLFDIQIIDSKDFNLINKQYTECAMLYYNYAKFLLLPIQ